VLDFSWHNLTGHQLVWRSVALFGFALLGLAWLLFEGPRVSWRLLSLAWGDFVWLALGFSRVGTGFV